MIDYSGDKTVEYTEKAFFGDANKRREEYEKFKEVVESYLY